MKKLSLRQLKFIKYYIKGHSGAESVRLAGYRTKRPNDTANELLKQKNIQNKLRHYTTTNEKEISKTIDEIKQLAFAKTKDKLTKAVKVKCLELLARIQKLTTETEIKQQTIIINYPKIEGVIGVDEDSQVPGEGIKE